MGNKSVKIRFFTIADYEDEEIWLRVQHKKGWKLVKTIIPCFYIFEKCEPEDVIYRLDFKNNQEDSTYMQMLYDYGWEYFEQCMGWLYFRKSAKDTDNEQDGELFSDNNSRVELVKKIVRHRLLPITVIFLCCIIPNLIKVSFHSYDLGDKIIGATFIVLYLIYVFLILYCGSKLRRIKKKYSNDK